MGRVALTPLTLQEQEFAAEHHRLLYQYLHSRKLSIEEWYDVLLFSYLQSVKKWFAEPDIQRYSFSTIVYNSMRSGVQRERQKQKRRIQPLSLDERIAGTEDLTYCDTITYENLRYIPYITDGEEEMNIKYNVKLPERSSNSFGKKSDETLAIESFLAGNMKNMCFEYESKEEAKKKYATIRPTTGKDTMRSITRRSGKRTASILSAWKLQKERRRSDAIQERKSSRRYWRTECRSSKN